MPTISETRAGAASDASAHRGSCSPKKRVRVLHCIHSLLGGGAERQLLLLAKAGADVGIDSTIFCINAAGMESKHRDVHIEAKPWLNRHPLRTTMEVIRELDRCAAQVAHVWLPPAMTIPAMIASRSRGVPCVLSYRNRMWLRDVRRFVELVTAACCAAAVVSNNPIDQSGYLHRLLFRWKQGEEINNAIGIAVKDRPNRNRDRARYGVKLLFVGRLARQKNWQTLLRSVARLSAHEKWTLDICGEGEDRSAVENTVREMRLCSKVNMLGFREDITDLMARADILIAPSWYEGAPNAVMEAMTLGLPVILSDIPAHRALVGHTRGVPFFRPESEDELVAQLRIAFEDFSGFSVRQVGLANLPSQTPVEMAKKYFCIYARLAASWTSG